MILGHPLLIPHFFTSTIWQNGITTYCRGRSITALPSTDKTLAQHVSDLPWQTPYICAPEQRRARLILQPFILLIYWLPKRKAFYVLFSLPSGANSLNGYRLEAKKGPTASRKMVETSPPAFVHAFNSFLPMPVAFSIHQNCSG